MPQLQNTAFSIGLCIMVYQIGKCCNIYSTYYQVMYIMKIVKSSVVHYSLLFISVTSVSFSCILISRFSQLQLTCLNGTATMYLICTGMLSRQAGKYVIKLLLRLQSYMPLEKTSMYGIVVQNLRLRNALVFLKAHIDLLNNSHSDIESKVLC